MILGIGIDTIDIDRFKSWASYPRDRLRRLFSDAEIDYCLAIPAKSAERFATRFAAREAFLKALSTAAPAHQISLLWVSKQVEVCKATNNAPALTINWEAVLLKIPSLKKGAYTHISLSHSAHCATAIVILEG